MWYLSYNSCTMMGQPDLLLPVFWLTATSKDRYAIYIVSNQNVKGKNLANVKEKVSKWLPLQVRTLLLIDSTSYGRVVDHNTLHFHRCSEQGCVSQTRLGHVGAYPREEW